VDAYTPQGYSGNVVIFYPNQDAYFNLKEATRTGLGWRACTSGRIDILQVPGAHISMLAEPYVGQLAQQLARLIADRTQAGGTLLPDKR